MRSKNDDRATSAPKQLLPAETIIRDFISTANPETVNIALRELLEFYLLYSPELDGTLKNRLHLYNQVTATMELIEFIGLFKDGRE